MRWTTARIRQSFLDFFKERGHTVVPSASLVPKGDPTLLFTNAGMVPFKDYFLGVRRAPSPRVVNCQKCLRISGKHNDLEAVGRDTYHHTFFEMLGNWSFGDYYKRDAIQWHWELLTRVWEISPERLYATVYQDDDEAAQVWNTVKDLAPGRILPFGEKYNFWEMGETGPCGPCSEIHIDRGDTACSAAGHPGQACGVNVDGCERFIELANLVFIQYDRDASGKLTPLPMKHVDTGTGLERVAAVLQSFEQGRLLSNYDIDLFQTIIRSIQKIAEEYGRSIRYGDSEEVDISLRAIADHARAISFLIAEGLRPANTDREYVLRRLMRRAMRHGQRLGITGLFLNHVCEGVVEAMGGAYPELLTSKAEIREATWLEYEQFASTLSRGLQLIREWELVESMGGAAALEGADWPVLGLVVRRTTQLPGEIAFRLYDTYGFPLDLTQAILAERGMTVDIEGFNRLMDEQRERGRAARREEAVAPEIQLAAGAASRFVGYHDYVGESEILAASAQDSESIAIVVAETPFYPEGGGQVGDRGVIETESGAMAEVIETKKRDGAILHLGRMLRGEAGEFERGRRVKLTVDPVRREAAMLNHSATHVLHYALRDILGKQVQQAGSLVAPDRLRFDFSHQGPVSENDLATIEEEINARIREDAEVVTEEMAYDDAIRAGALAFFGDKYGDRVRVVRMGDFSTELCGGTHVNRTGRIGLFKFEAESGVAAGVRRVEALTGAGALEAIRRREQILDELAGRLGARDADALERLQRLLEREKELEKNLRALEQKLASQDMGAGAAGAEVREVAGIKVVTRKLDGVAAHALREMADRLRDKYGSCVVALGSNLGEGKAALLVAVTPDLTSRVKAGDVIRKIAPIIGGSGGGRPDFAQAGGRQPSRLDEALGKVASIVGAGDL